MKNKILATFSMILLGASSAQAGSPQFQSPVDCTLEDNCWIVNYVDMDPGHDHAIDHKCSSRTYDTHKGTDFALKNYAEMLAGVDVKAAMAGRVLRFRDGETDTIKAKADLKALSEKNRDCGNGILLDHAPAGYQGLQTMYCHLKKGSIKVQKDQIVAAGESIAQIGHSGFTEFPHLHFGVIWEGGVVDPFTGTLNTEGCKSFKDNMWKDEDTIKYEPISIFDGGFSGSVPDFDKIKRGTFTPRKPSAKADVFLFWVGLYGVEKDDEISIRVQSPDGSTYVERNLIQDKNKARQFYYSGKKLHSGSDLPNGTYIGTITITRAGQSPKRKEFSTVVY